MADRSMVDWFFDTCRRHRPAQPALPAMPLPDTLITPRLHLRAPAASDALALFRSHAEGDELAGLLVLQAQAWVRATADSIADALSRWAQGERPYAITLADGGEVIGMLDARVLGRALCIGYVIAAANRGQGLATEAVRALVQAAWADGRFDAVTATCEAGNHASARVLRKCGFVRDPADAASALPEPPQIHRYATLRRSPSP
jgi:RimJ/RimL family protein N-acetyltransferase